MLVTVSEHVRRACTGAPDRAEWLRDLPMLVREVCERWDIALERSSDDATCSFVAIGRRCHGLRIVLKIGMPHFEAEHEIDGLLFWDGDPTVRVFEYDRECHAMLLEYCDGSRPLRAQPEQEQDTVIVGLLRRLWRMPPPPRPFKPLSDMIDLWSDESRAQRHKWPDASLVRDGLSAFEELVREDSERTLLATDLHAGNVLRAERQPWLVIDPKPFVGDPAYDATQHLLNCRGRLETNAFETINGFAGMLGVDAQRVRHWLFARLAAEPRDNWLDGDSMNLARRLAP